MEFTAHDYKGKKHTFRVAGKLIHRHGAVSLIQPRKNRFIVVYGLQVSKALDYTGAATEYGLCLMHQLACDGKFDAEVT